MSCAKSHGVGHLRQMIWTAAPKELDGVARNWATGYEAPPSSDLTSPEISLRLGFKLIKGKTPESDSAGAFSLAKMLEE